MTAFDLLLSRLRKWRRWTRLHKSVYHSARGLLGGLSIAAVLAAFLTPSGNLSEGTYVRLLIAAAALGFVIAVAVAWLWPGSRLKMARDYEQAFGLKERISTAIELNLHDRGDQTWRDLQLDDALEATERIIPKTGLPWRFPKLEMGMLLITTVLVLGSWFYGERSFRQAEINSRNRSHIEEETDNVENLITRIERDEQLSGEEKEALLEPLQDTLENLDQAESLEDAVSVLQEAQQTLEEFSAPGRDKFEGLQQAGEDLIKNQDNPLSPVGEALSQGDVQTAAETLAKLDLSTMDNQSLANLAEQLLEAAESLESSSPELAQHLQQAAEALQTDDLQAAQGEMAESSEALLDTAQQLAFSRTSSESAAELAESQERLIESAMSGSSAQSDSSQTNSNQNPISDLAGNFGSLAGSGEFDQPDAPGQEVGLTPLNQDNTPGETGEKKYDSVYAPERMGGVSETDLSLGTNEDGESTTLGGINSSFVQGAQSSVPYSQVFSNYEQSSQQALDTGLIPLSLQPLIREYFSSLDPK